MRRWIGLAFAAAVLCAAAWYFGRPNNAPVASPPTVAAVSPAPVEAHPAPLPKVLDVIDLARAYEPVPEPEQILPGGIDPATFIEERSAPATIPPAVDLEEVGEDLLTVLQATSSCLGWGVWSLPMPERAQAQSWELLLSTDMGPWIFYHLYGSDLEFMRRQPLNIAPQRVAVRSGVHSTGLLEVPELADNPTETELIDIMPRETGLQVVDAWQEALATWLIASWSGPMTCPKLIPVAPAGDDR
ncbi:MAG TPA: hypothetical protein VKD71_03865 [Gemmataceae bacterium]|nr:hypothetical protein [Gemmataceae bacterium]